LVLQVPSFFALVSIAPKIVKIKICRIDENLQIGDLKLMETARPQNVDIASFIKNGRTRLYKTAREFWENHREYLDVSYPHYSAVEAGAKFPEVKLAIRIAEKLKLDLKLTCHIWARDQMPDAKTMSFFEPTLGSGDKSFLKGIGPNLDEFYIFSERQLPDLIAQEFIWDVHVVINSYTGYLEVTREEVRDSLKLSDKEIDHALKWLEEEHCIRKTKSGGWKSTQKHFHLPNTAPFIPLRNKNFFRTNKAVIPQLTPEILTAKTGARSTIQRRLTAAQAAAVVEQINYLVGMMSNLEDHGDEVYALSFAIGPRLKVQRKMGLKTSKVTTTQKKASLA